MSEVLNIEERVKKAVRDQMSQFGVEVDIVANDAKLHDDLGFDSLDLVEAVMAVEDDFGIYIDDDEMEALETVQQLIDCVSGKV